MADVTGPAEATQATNEPSWLPLESNPDVLNPFIKRLGVPEDWGFTDVFGLDEELLAMVPQPCAALCLLFPSENISKAHRADMLAKRPKDGPAPPVFFVQQGDDMGNACGTIAAVHAVANAAAVCPTGLEPQTRRPQTGPKPQRRHTGLEP